MKEPHAEIYFEDGQVVMKVFFIDQQGERRQAARSCAEDSISAEALKLTRGASQQLDAITARADADRLAVINDLQRGFDGLNKEPGKG